MDSNMKKQIVLFLCIWPNTILWAMDQTNMMVTLIANDSVARVQVPRSSLSQIAQEFLNHHLTTEKNTIACSFVNAQGLPYLKDYLTAPNKKDKNAVIQQLISQESIATIHGLNQHLDCWQMLENSDNYREAFEQLNSQGGTLRKTIITPDGTIYAITSDHKFLRINPNKEKVECLHQENNRLIALAINCNNTKVYFGGISALLYSFNTASNDISAKQFEKSFYIHDIAVSPDNSFMLVTNYCWIYKYDQYLDKMENLIRSHKSPLLITNDSKQIISFDGNLYVANATGEKIKTSTHDWKNNSVKCMAFASSGNTLIASSLKETVIFDLHMNELAKLPDLTNDVTFMNAHNNCIVVGDNKGTIYLWKYNQSTQSVHLIAQIKHHENKITNIVFSHNGRRIACAGADQKTILIDEDGNLIDSWNLKNNHRGQTRINFGPRDEEIILSNYTETIVRPLKPDFQQFPILVLKKIYSELRKIKSLDTKNEKLIHIKALKTQLKEEGLSKEQINQLLNVYQ